MTTDISIPLTCVWAITACVFALNEIVEFNPIYAWLQLAYLFLRGRVYLLCKYILCNHIAVASIVTYSFWESDSIPSFVGTLLFILACY